MLPKDDIECVNAASSGDEGAFARLVDAHRGVLQALPMR